MAVGHVLTCSRFLVLVLALVLTLKPFKPTQKLNYGLPSLLVASNLVTETFSRFYASSSCRRSRGTGVTSVFKVKMGLHVLKATLVAVYLILLAGDVSMNPGPSPVGFPGGSGKNGSQEFKNIPVLISNRTYNYSRSFKRPTMRNIIEVPIVRDERPSAKRHLRLCSLNARSLKNKSADFVCYALSTGADVFAITETWFAEHDMANRGAVTLPGYKLLDQTRRGRTGGGTALLFNESIDVQKVDGGECTSFEFSEYMLHYGSNKLRIVVVYRTPYSAAHPVTTAVFFNEFSSYLESIIMSPEPLLITGDFNIHVDTTHDSDRIHLLELLTSMGLEQHVDKPTHISGHTLDLIITRCSDPLLCAKPIADYLFSDHITVLCDLKLGKPSPKVKLVSYRKMKYINQGKLRADLLSSGLCKNTPDTLDDLVNNYNTTLIQALDRHAPLRTKLIQSRPLVPWFNEEIKEARREKRRAERKWRSTGSRKDMLAYKAKKNNTNSLMNQVRCKFYHDLIEDNSDNQRNLFSSVKKLLNQGDNKAVYPPVDDNVKLANQLGTFFVQKLETIGSKLDNLAQGLPPLHDGGHAQVIPHPFSNFTPLTEEEINKLISSSPKKSCILDPMPTSLVMECMDVLLPIITKMVNLSLESGRCADDWKSAVVLPLLKKHGLDLLYKNYRPVSNLQYISKLAEKAVFEQIHAHMMTYSLYPDLQSSYRRYHSTETALVKITNDILMKMNTQEVTLLVMLDLSAAFDTVNHAILLTRLSEELGICGVALEWFKSYLENRDQRILVDGSLSERFGLDSGVPQGSCLGPLLFIVYASKLFKVVGDELPHVHCYADDTQIYLSFKPSSSTSQMDAVRVIEHCIEKIRCWLIQDRLLINDDKTEFMIIGTRQQLCKLQTLNIHVGSSEIKPSLQVRNLGCWLDPNLNMRDHITNVCKAAFFLFV